MKETLLIIPTTLPPQAIPTIQELAAMRKDLDIVAEKIATARGTFAALETQRVQYEKQLVAVGIDPANSTLLLEAMKESIVHKNKTIQTAMVGIKEALTKAEEVQNG